MEKGYGALILGATGACGRELVNHLLNSNKWSKIHLIVRKQLQEWAIHPNKKKLVIEKIEDMDKLLQPNQFKYQGVDSLFCCLGSQTKNGEETFVKVDKTYPLKAADIALNNKIPHYLLISSVGANQSSWFLYPKTKGQVQRDLRLKNMPLLTIFRPGMLQNRHQARPIQKFASFLPFFPKIQAKDVSQILMRTAQRDIQKSRKSHGEVQLYENKQMLQMLSEQRKKQNK